MSISPINFKGLITITGKDPKSSITVNSDTISNINSYKYLSMNKDTIFAMEEATMMNLTNGSQIRVFAPMETVVDAYRKSANEDVELKTEQNPIKAGSIFNIL